MYINSHHSQITQNPSNEAVNIFIPEDIFKIIFNRIINQDSQALHDIYSILLTCQKWKRILEKNPSISWAKSLVQPFFQRENPAQSIQSIIYKGIEVSEHWTSQQHHLIGQVILAAAKKNVQILLHPDESLKKDPAILLAAIQNDGEDPQYAALRQDPQVILAAIQNHG